MDLQSADAVHREFTRPVHRSGICGVPSPETAIGGLVTLPSHFGNIVSVLVRDIAKKLWGNFE